MLIFLALCGIINKMNTAKSNDVFQIPSFAKREVYNFESDEDSFAIYRELSQIAEEIERCRLENC